MSDPLRTDTSRALEPGSEAERTARAETKPAEATAEAAKAEAGKAEAGKVQASRVEARKIEQLLLTGLDHYFAARYEQAINLWTRALFFDRGHARARAYIERARSALAERQRESEELLQNGLAAFNRGEADTARRLLQTAIDRGAPSDEALAVLGRLDRLEPGRPSMARSGRDTGQRRWSRERGTAGVDPEIAADRARDYRSWFTVAALLLIVATGLLVASASRFDWGALADLQPGAPAVQSAPPFIEAAPELPRRGRLSLDRARTLVAAGRLRDALELLERVRPTDLERPDADRLRADVQKELLALAGVPAAGSERETGHLGQP